jgi:molybdopterin-guanine dinucleotide biosynthesis protein A
MKKQNEFPPGWDEERVQSVIAHYEQQTEDEAEEALQNESRQLIEVPIELVPAVRELIAKHAAQNHPQAEQGS